MLNLKEKHKNSYRESVVSFKPQRQGNCEKK